MITVPARLPAPYVHADNRGLVLCNGAQCISIQASQLRQCAETFDIIAAEGRATRAQGPHVVGGYIRLRCCDLRRNPGSSAVRDRLVVRFRHAARGDRASPPMRPLLVALALLLVAAAPAQAEEKLVTLYSPPIDSEPYVHKSTTVQLKADGKQAPAEPGYVLGFQEMSLVDSKDPDAKPLPVAKMMVHHFLYFTQGRARAETGGCLGGDFLAGRGEEHPSGPLRQVTPPDLRARYGIQNATPQGKAPAWSLTAMVMNHYQRSKRFYVRTRIWYTTEPRTPVYPTAVGDCRHLLNGMAYDVPGGGLPGSTFTDRSTWTVPFSGRIVGAASHHHGGAINHTLASQTCGREMFNAKAYYGAADHPYNTIRPILHEPGPIANGTFRSAQGIPVAAGEVLERVALHDNATLHVAAMGFWVLLLAKDDRHRLSADAGRRQRGHRAGEVRHGGAVRVQPQGPAAVQAGRAADGVQRPRRRPVLPRRPRDREGRPAADVAVHRRRAAQRDRRQRPARLLLQLPRHTCRQLLVHADGRGHVPADVPDPPDDDGADARRQTDLKKLIPSSSSAR